MEIVSQYKEAFNKHRPKEIYKWEAVKCFQDNWNDQVEDFKQMLSKSLSKQINLLTQYELMGLNRLAKDYPDELRNIFLQLFNDDGMSIVDRTRRFLTAVTSLSTSDEDNVIKHNQTERAVSVYLFLKKPEENYIYNRVGKFERLAELVEYTDYPNKTGLEKLKSYYEMCDKLREYIIEDQELLSMSANSLISPDNQYYQDVNYRLLTDDIVFIGSWNKENAEWWPSEEEYHPGIDKEQWKELWVDNAIFNEIAKKVVSRFLAFEEGATCKQVSLKYGETGNFYNGASKALAERIYKAGYCELFNDDDKLRYFPILYTGKRAGKNVEGDYMWKLRHELIDALKEMGVEPIIVDEKEQRARFKEWYANNVGSINSASTISSAIGKARLKDGRAIFSITDYYELSRVIDTAGLKGYFEARDGDYSKMNSVLDIEPKTQLDDLKNGIKYYLRFLNDDEADIEEQVNVDNLNMEEDFLNWFSTLKKPDGTTYADNYKNQLRNCLRYDCKKLKDLDLQEHNLFFVTDANEYSNLKERIVNSEFYSSVDEQAKNGAFSRSLEFYGDFLKNRAEGHNFEEDGENEFKNVDYYSEIILALRELGGKALWREICDCIEENGHLSAIASNSTWRYTVSSYLQYKCSDSPQFKGKEDLFSWDRATKIWGLREMEVAQTSDLRELPKRNPRQSSKHQMNAILYGAPGTGKTYSVTEYAMAIIEDRDVNNNPVSEEERENLLNLYKEMTKSGQVVFTTFHQNYGYEDFIQGLRPVLKSEIMKFSVEDGVFKKISDKAMNDNDNNYVIIIDEINRANISRVFGELITLIETDKRWGEANELSVTLPSGDLFAIPNNLYIIGTMNSADKSISLIDTALRRRFDFIEIAPNASLIENNILRKILKALNKELLSELDSSDLLIGHAYFINKAETDLVNIMNRNIIPLLYEYFHDNERKVKSVVSKAIEGLEYDIEEKSIGRLRIK